jgi:hypothetical protein
MNVRILVIIVLGLVGLVGLGMSLCGGFFTVAGLADLGDHGRRSGEFRMSGFLIMSVPSLLVGLGLVLLAARGINKRSGDSADRTSH